MNQVRVAAVQVVRPTLAEASTAQCVSERRVANSTPIEGAVLPRAIDTSLVYPRCGKRIPPPAPDGPSAAGCLWLDASS
jgi:hypothetical protein